MPGMPNQHGRSGMHYQQQQPGSVVALPWVIRDTAIAMRPVVRRPYFDPSYVPGRAARADVTDSGPPTWSQRCYYYADPTTHALVPVVDQPDSQPHPQPRDPPIPNPPTDVTPHQFLIYEIRDDDDDDEVGSDNDGDDAIIPAPASPLTTAPPFACQNGYQIRVPLGFPRKLGIRIEGGAEHGGDPSIVVSSVEDPAKSAGICVHDRVVAVNGQSLQHATHSQAVQLIQQQVSQSPTNNTVVEIVRGIPVYQAQPTQPPRADQPQLQTKTITIPRRLGLVLQPASSSANDFVVGGFSNEYAGALTPGGAVKINDKIVAVGSRSLATCTRAQGLEVLRDALADLGTNIVVERSSNPISVSVPWTLGLKISGGSDKPEGPTFYISEIQHNSVADRSRNFLVGDQVLKVNGVDLENLSHAEALTAFTKRGISEDVIVIKRQAVTAPLRRIRVRPNNQQLGITVKGGTDCPVVDANPSIYISNVEKDSPAEQAGLAKGDRILMAQGKSLGSVSHTEAVHALKTTGQEVELLLEPNVMKKAVGRKESKTLAEVMKKNLQQVQLQPVDGSFGITIIGGEGKAHKVAPKDSGVFVLEVKPGSPAAQANLKPGDRLVSANGIILHSMQHEAAASLLAVLACDAKPTTFMFVSDEIAFKQ